MRLSLTTTLLFLLFLACACRPLPKEEPTPEPALGPPSEAASDVKIIYPNVPGSFVSTTKKVKPSVVNIFTAQVVQDRRHGFSMFEDLFGRPHKERIQRSLGSGFIIDAQGYIFTNYHVIRGAQQILVQLEDKRQVPATPVGIEPGIDAALLHIDADKLQPATMGNSDQLEVGEWVMAIGNPFGLSHTVTAGIVSAKGRSWQDLGAQPGTGGGYQNFIQTDASINPGNSGGPLVNVAGEVMGMNTAITAEGQGIGFAVPINMLKTILPQLKRSGRVLPAWLGIGIRDMDERVSQITGASNGVVVTELFQEGPAYESGLRVGDVVVQFNDTEVRDSSMLAWMTATAGIGNKVKLNIIRERKTLQLEVEVQAKPYSD
ncbi:MAG: trypsin-like peptidase domain-containing protein [Deltaproteobacteria bacterium]|nr:trypsin-like peptidase domain-containing protein [Deltaproteobacteria bacterium]MBN2671760.1 trypsin-like peptidase domain-containing protein [Deltaproteobacteria bacterium]